MKVRTRLVSGAGNTFHVLCSIENEINFSPNVFSTLAKQLCEMHGADGFILLKPSLEVEMDYEWYFYNNDGSEAEMCGNASRCVGFAIENYFKDYRSLWRLKTVAGTILIRPDADSQYKVTMTPIIEKQSQFGLFCDTGVPHLVIELDSLKNIVEKKPMAKKLRLDSEFFPRGTNVTYVEMGSEKNKVNAVSYERGVEDFTAACGTGAMAAAYYNYKKRAVTQTEVAMPGGILKMDLNDLQKPTMSGPAILLGSYEYEFAN